MAQKLLRISVIFAFTVLTLGTAKAQCGLTQEELAQYGPWICPEAFPPGYKPSPGFPGNPNPIQLPEVNVNSGSIPILYGYSPGPAFPVIFNPSYNPNKPRSGDPVLGPEIAPSNYGGTNFRGGMYGNTRKRPDGTTKFHDGIDIAAKPGTEIYSMHAGKVVDIVSTFKAGQYKANSYGNFVTIRSIINGQTVYLKYNHLDGISGQIKMGQDIAAGEIIAKAGTTGNAASPDVKFKHLHVQAKDVNLRSIDPAPYFNTKFDPNTGKAIN